MSDQESDSAPRRPKANRKKAGASEQHEAAEEHERGFARRWPWLLPLAAGIFLGGAAIEMFPEALAKAGTPAWFWALGGVILFVLVRDGLDAIGQHGLAWVATLGIWLHSFLEGAVAGSSYGVSLGVGLLVSAGLILHLIPEVGAVFALLGAAGLSFRQALVRNGITWALIVVGFLVVYFYLPRLSPALLGSTLAVGAGGFLYLAYLSWKEREWRATPSVAVAAAGVLVIALFKFVAG